MIAQGCECRQEGNIHNKKRAGSSIKINECYKTYNEDEQDVSSINQCQEIMSTHRRPAEDTPH